MIEICDSKQSNNNVLHLFKHWRAQAQDRFMAINYLLLFTHYERYITQILTVHQIANTIHD